MLLEDIISISYRSIKVSLAETNYFELARSY